MSKLFNQVHHICIVVADLAATERAYEAVGIGPWYDYPKAGDYVEFDVPNTKASKATRYRCTDLGNIQLQLCQPPEMDSPQRRFLDRFGEGVYHIGFEVPNLEDAEADAADRKLPIISRGRRADGSGFCYFDTQELLGVILEIRKTSPALATEHA